MLFLEVVKDCMLHAGTTGTSRDFIADTDHALEGSEPQSGSDRPLLKGALFPSCYYHPAVFPRVVSPFLYPQGSGLPAGGGAVGQARIVSLQQPPFVCLYFAS